MTDFTLTFPADFLWGATTAAHQVEGSSVPTPGPPGSRCRADAQARGRAGLRLVGRALCRTSTAPLPWATTRTASRSNGPHRAQRGGVQQEAIAHYADTIAALPGTWSRCSRCILHRPAVGSPGKTASNGYSAPLRPLQIVAEELGGGVTMWCTVNEPLAYAVQGYLLGRFPPGERSLGRATRR